MSILETKKKMTVADLKVEIATLKQIVSDRDNEIEKLKKDHIEEIHNLNTEHWQTVARVESARHAYLREMREQMMHIYEFAQQMMKFENGESVWQQLADMANNDNIKY